MSIGSFTWFGVPIVLALGMLLGALVTPTNAAKTKFPKRQLNQIQEPQETETQEEEQQVEREKIFEGWEAPELALFISGRQDGYIEPCGCTGLANQLGGMMRRHTFLEQLLASNWNIIGIDSGNQVRRFGRQANLKLTTTYQSFGQAMRYDAVGFGPNDLALPTIELMQAMTNSGLPNQNFVCANVTVFDSQFSSKFRVVEKGGKRVGITTVVGDEHREKLLDKSDIQFEYTLRALPGVIAAMDESNCDVKVLVANASLENARELANKFPVFDLLVCAGVDGEPTRLPEKLSHSNGHVTSLIQTGNKGMYVGVVGLFQMDEKIDLKYQRVPMDARFEDSETIKEIFLSYQKQMQALTLEGMEVNAVAHPSNNQYVGSEACYDCHDQAFDIWKDGIDGNGGPHARATLDLTEPGERTWVQRHHDPECLSCHVTGWNPQEYFPYQSGYLTLDDSLLHGNGCENCHGPGSKHVAAENGDIDVSEQQRVQYYEEMIVTLEQARKKLCISCHDLDNSPDFHVEGAFEEYWEQIKHYED